MNAESWAEIPIAPITARFEGTVRDAAGAPVANETIGERREELSKVEQQQARALTAAEVERNRGELYAQQQSQGGQELDRLAQEAGGGTALAVVVMRHGGFLRFSPAR